MVTIMAIYANIEGTLVLICTAPMIPTVTNRINMIATAVLDFFEVGKPSLKSPADRKINPKNIHKIETACIPSIKVLAIPERAMATPVAPTAVKPAPGMSKSQSVINILKGDYGIINSFFILILKITFSF
jgi:hypothetical protein